MPCRPPRSPLFPYTTLFRSAQPGAPGLQTAVGVELERGLAAIEGGGDVVGRELEQGRALQRGILATAERFLERSEEHTSELQSRENLVCRLLLEKKKNITTN